MHIFDPKYIFSVNLAKNKVNDLDGKALKFQRAVFFRSFILKHVEGIFLGNRCFPSRTGFQGLVCTHFL